MMFPLGSDRGSPQPSGVGLLVVLSGLSLGLLSTGAEEPPSAPPSEPELILLSQELDLGTLPLDAEVVSEPLRGEVICPTGSCRLGILLPLEQEQIFLVWEDHGTGRTATLPLTWELRFRTLGSWGNWGPPESGPTQDGQKTALWWEIGKGGAGKYEFELRCRVKTDPWPLAGNYQTNLSLTVEGGPSPP